MGAILATARRHGLWVIEDGAEAHLACYAGATVGGLAYGGAFSFYGNKIFTTGEGGAVTLRDTSVAERVRALRHQGVRPGRDPRYTPSLTGHSFRMSNLSAAVGCAQLARAEELMARRRSLVEQYRKNLASAPGVTLQPVEPWAEPAPWLLSVLIDDGQRGWGRNRVADHLYRSGIESRPLFPPLDSLAAGSPASGGCPVAHRLSRQGLNLPLFADMRPEDVDRVTATLVECVGSPTKSVG
jgi:perosamine synthetase